jgi:hypothetical protein
MPSAVATIRQETVERLAGLAAFQHVYDSRQPQLKRDMLPAVRVYTTGNSQNQSLNIIELRTTINLVVQIVAEDITDASNAERVDDLCEITKHALFRDPLWLRMFERVLSLDIEVDRNVEGEWRSTTATLSFALQCTEAFGPDDEASWPKLPWLKQADVRVDVIDPAADPNTGPPGTPPNVPGGYPGGHPGPDGRIEVHASFLNPPEEDP